MDRRRAGLPPETGSSCSKQSAPEHRLRNGEIDYQSRDIDQRGNERRRGGSWIEPPQAQKEGKE